MMGMVGEGRVYRVEAIDGRVECPVCHTIIDSEDFESYEFLDIDIVTMETYPLLL